MEISAGGVVVKNGSQVLLARREEHWQLPKGLVEEGKGEKIEETAIREVKEETGINARIIKPLGKVNYWYYRDNKRIYKTVYFFLMEAISGDVNEHDHEMDEVRWFEMDEAINKIAYRNEKDILEKAKKELRGDLIWGNWSS